MNNCYNCQYWDNIDNKCAICHYKKHTINCTSYEEKTSNKQSDG
jgi:hypothetical protein